MLIQGGHFKNMSVGSIRSSARIGRCEDIIINPHNLHIDAFVCRIIGERKAQLITPEDIRDISPRGIIIDDHDRLIDPEDAVRLKPIMKLGFSLNKLQAYVGRRRVGTVEDFAVDKDSLFIIKIYVQPKLFNRWSFDRLVFGRQQVEEVTSSKIIFTDSSKQKAKSLKIPETQASLAQPSLNASLTKE